MSALLALVVSVTAQLLLLRHPAPENSPDLAARLDVPHKLRINRSFEVTVTVTDLQRMDQGMLFKRHWKWTKYTMYLELRDSEGKVTTSEVDPGDIASSFRCFYFKPLGGGDSYSFATAVNTGEGGLRMKIPKAGTYWLRWKYENDDAESGCEPVEVKTWVGKLETEWVKVVIE